MTHEAQDEGREPTAAEAREITREAHRWAREEAARRRARGLRHATASERRLALVVLAQLRTVEGGSR